MYKTIAGIVLGLLGLAFILRVTLKPKKRTLSQRRHIAAQQVRDQQKKILKRVKKLKKKGLSNLDIAKKLNITESNIRHFLPKTVTRG